MPTPTQQDARTPYALTFAISALIAAILQITLNQHPESIGQILSWSWGMFWSVLVGVGGLAIVLGAFWRDALTGIAIEAGGQAFMVVAFLCYSIALYSFYDQSWYTSTLFWWTTSVVIAAGYRLLALNNAMARARILSELIEEAGDGR